MQNSNKYNNQILLGTLDVIVFNVLLPRGVQLIVICDYGYEIYVVGMYLDLDHLYKLKYSKHFILHICMSQLEE